MKEQSHSKHNLIVQGSILAIASLIVRVIGFFYRVPLTNIIGDEGSGYYAVAFNIYTFFLMISTYGFPAALSKLNSTLLTQRKYKESHQLIRAALLLAFIVGTIFSLLMWFGAGSIARMYENENIIWSIKALAPALFCFSLMSVLRGYFQGFNTMMPTAVSQIVEQIFNAIFSVIMAYILIEKGTEFGAAGGTLGTGIGALFGLIVMIFVYYGARKTVIKRWYEHGADGEEAGTSLFGYWRLILSTSIPLVMGSLITYFIAIVDTFMLNKSMIASGFDTVVASEYVGIYSLKYLLIINLPIIAISSSLTSSLIPSISTSLALDDFKAIQNKARAVFKIALIVLIPAAVGEAVFARPILTFLFQSSYIDLAANLLYIGAINIVLAGVVNLLAGILIGINKLKVQIYTTLTGSIIKILLNFIFLYVLNLNVYGLVLGNICFNIILVSLKSYFVYKNIGMMIDIKRSVLYPLIAAFIMGGVGYIVYLGLLLIIGNTDICVILGIIISALIYLFTILRFNVINEAELRGAPKGDKIVSLLKRLRMI